MMFRNKKVVVVMPAYNAARTLQRTYDEVMAQEIVDLVIIVDDASKDDTVAVARTLPNTVLHVHPDEPRLRRQSEDVLSPGAGGRRRHRHHDPSRLPVHPASDPGHGRHARHGLVSVRAGVADSRRIRLAGRDALVEIRLQPLPHLRREPVDGREVVGVSHRAIGRFPGSCWSACPWRACADDFVFDNQMLAQILWLGATIAEVSCPTRYEPESSSINLSRSIVYGLGCLRTALGFRLAKMRLIRSALFPRELKGRWKCEVPGEIA